MKGMVSETDSGLLQKKGVVVLDLGSMYIGIMKGRFKRTKKKGGVIFDLGPVYIGNMKGRFQGGKKRKKWL